MKSVAIAGLLTAALALVAHGVSAESESPPAMPNEYVTVHYPEYSVDVPASWVKQPSVPAMNIIATLVLGAFTDGPQEHLLETLLNGHTYSVVNASAVPEDSGSLPTISVTVGPSSQPADVFVQDYNVMVREVYALLPANPYLVYENRTESGGVLNWWWISTGGPASQAQWMKQASYILVDNNTAYIVEYTADLDAYDDNYKHFERAASSFVPYDGWTAPPVGPEQPTDPRCTGGAQCIAGNVTRVIDGDTLDVGDVRVRLALVNAGELGTFKGDIAHRIVGAVCQAGSAAVIDEDDGQTQGSYGRMLGVVWCGNVNLNELLVDIKYGQIDTRYCHASEFSEEPWAAACRR